MRSPGADLYRFLAQAPECLSQEFVPSPKVERKAAWRRSGIWGQASFELAGFLKRGGPTDSLVLALKMDGGWWFVSFGGFNSSLKDMSAVQLMATAVRQDWRTEERNCARYLRTDLDAMDFLGLLPRQRLTFNYRSNGKSRRSISGGERIPVRRGGEIGAILGPTAWTGSDTRGR